MKLLITTTILLLSVGLLSAQTQQDTIYTPYSATPVVIDGSDADNIWSKAEWHTMSQVWIPFNDVMDEGDFEGKYKVAWDKNYLYVLVEVVDNILSDDHKNPTDNYWNDDCVEVFIDEDRSKGIHQTNNNAFAYHCSVFYDVIDGAGTNGATINCRNNITMVMDTLGENKYRWELALKMYNKNFTYSNAEASRVFLSPNKLMGFSIAYCDNDETTGRENFIGSVVMPEAHANDSYINADYFGTMLLVDRDKQWVSTSAISKDGFQFSLFPSVVKDELTIACNQPSKGNYLVEMVDSKGSIVKEFSFSGQQKTIGLNDLTNGLYVVRFTNEQYTQSLKFLKL